MSKTTMLASGQITVADKFTIELVESIETLPVVLLRWPGQPSVIQPHRFPAVADQVRAIMAAAIARLAVMEGDY
jgi:hypothetical protein